LGFSKAIFKGYWPITVWAVLIFGLHILPSEHIPKPPDWNISFDKVVHFVLFAVLSFLLLEIGNQNKKRNSYSILLIALICITYGFLMESVQILVPGRQFHLLDLIADSFGVIAGLLGYLGFSKLEKSR
jgi:VanZ family protein